MSSFDWPSKSGGVPIYANLAAFPASADTGSLGVAADSGIIYEWTGSSWVAIAAPGDVLSVGAFGSTPNANGLSVSSNVLSLQPADATHPGGLTAADWNTFNNKQAAVSFAAVGSTPSANGGGISAGVITLQPASSTLPGLVTAIAQSFGGAKRIIGNADGVQLRVTGNATQTNDLLLIENSIGSPIFEVNNSGNSTTAGASVASTMVSSSGSAGAPGFTFMSNFDTGMYLPAGSTLGLAAGGVQVWKATSSAITLPLLTASKLIATDASKVMTSVTALASYCKAPLVTKYTSGSGTHTLTESPLYITVELVGGGGGAGGVGTAASGGNGGNGGDSTFGTSLLSAGGGVGSNANANGGVGGAASLGSGPTGVAVSGGDGCQKGGELASGSGGQGGSSALGGAGFGADTSNAGGAGKANTGGGGGGSGGVAAGTSGSGGGGSGAYVRAFISGSTLSGLSGSASYAVGAGGAAGTAGTAGTAGGAGGSGVVIVTEYYQ